MKRVQKVGLKEAYVQEESVKEVVQCFFGLPLLPVDDISDALEDVRLAIPADSPHAEKLQQLARYVKRQWLDRRSVAHSVCAFGIAPPERTTCLNVIMPVCGSRSEVTHPNLFVFLTHLQKATADSMADMLRVRNGIKIRRAKKEEESAKRHSHSSHRGKVRCWITHTYAVSEGHKPQPRRSYGRL